MVDNANSGRHRGSVRYNPASELSTIVKSAGQTSVKASAVLAASGGLVATFALPAQAAPRPAAAATAAQAAPATLALAAPVALAPAVVAPAAASPVAVEVVGVVGVKAVAKPKPKPRPVPVAVQAVTTRSSSSSSTASRSTSSSSSSSSSSSRSTSSSKSTTAARSTANVQQSSSAVVNIARGLLGIPYVYGGTTTSGFDCSGFTQYVFRKAGISLPRIASAQQDAATPVSNPQPGDLIFYGSPAWHVGIYTGNGMMIDSPRPGKFSSERPIFSGVTGYGRF